MRRIVGATLAAILAAAAPAAGQTGPPPTPVPPFGSPSPYPQSLETPAPSARPPRIAAPSAVLVDLSTGHVLWERRPDRPRPIASLTKIMTVLIALESSNLDDVVTVSERATDEEGSELGLEAGERISVEDLLYALMLQSSNDGAIALAEHFGGSVDRFVRMMNRRARELGLESTEFSSPHGLEDRGLSTARDMAALTTEAFTHPAFVRIARTKVRAIPAAEGPPRRIQSRNAMLWLYPGSVGVKTGFTSAAGFCLVAAAERDGRRFAAVILGGPSAAFSDAATVLDHGFFTWRVRPVVEEGAQLQPVSIDGREVPVETGGTIEGLVRRGQGAVLRSLLDPSAGLPVRAGDVVGEVAAIVEGQEVGRAPLVAAEDVGSPAEDRALPPWWDDLLDSIASTVPRWLETIL
ncbi:MAG TPA: D-alanyl-D-alanine carboxypeptidase family protein [Actinomycetota bacterium]